MILWHLYSKVLDGFYQSDVLVVASQRAEAVDRACTAVRKWMLDHAKEYGYVFNLYEEDDDFQESVEAKLSEFRKEAEDNISRVSGGAIVMHKS